MARLPPLDPADAEPAVRAALERLPPLAIFTTVANAQGAFVNWLRFGGDCLDARWFDPVLRELAILRVARLTAGAEYEWVQHVPILLAVGGTPEQVAALEADDLQADALGEDGRLVVRFTGQVVRDATPDGATFAAMSARFTTAEIAQLQVDAVLGADVLAGVERSSRARRQGAQAPD